MPFVAPSSIAYLHKSHTGVLLTPKSHFKGSAVCPSEGLGQGKLTSNKHVPAGLVTYLVPLETLWSVLFEMVLTAEHEI